MNIAALVSGGVDSSVVVHLLKEQGYTPDIFYIRIGAEDDGTTATAMERFDCPAEEDIEITGYIAKKYGCRFEVVDLHREYWDNVVAYTIDTVRKGLTPNPDIMCNKLIKFGAFEQRCGKDYDFTATGHYATTECVKLPITNTPAGTLNSQLSTLNFLATAKDPVKDQTDFLSQLSCDQIQKLMFPIGHLMKSEVRAIAEQAELPSATRKDSQGICFLGKINYNEFLRRYLGEREGKIVELETGKILGTHRGYWFHTIGQRKGLFLSGGPWFVVKKDVGENVLYVSQGYDPDTQYGTTVNLVDFHYLTCPLPEWESALNAGQEVPVKFKIRHTPEFTQGYLSKIESSKLKVEATGRQSTAPQFSIKSIKRLQGIAAGQYTTIYDNDAHLVVASGQIANSLV